MQQIFRLQNLNHAARDIALNIHPLQWGKGSGRARTDPFWPQPFKLLEGKKSTVRACSFCNGKCMVPHMPHRRIIAPNSVYKGVATNLHHYYTAEFLMQMRKVSSKKSAPWLWVHRTWCHSEWLLFKTWAEPAPLKDKTASRNALRSSDQKKQTRGTNGNAVQSKHQTLTAQYKHKLTGRGRKMSKFYKELHDIHCHRPALAPTVLVYASIAMAASLPEPQLSSE